MRDLNMIAPAIYLRTVGVELPEDLLERDARALGLQLLQEEGDGLERLRDCLHILLFKK